MNSLIFIVDPYGLPYLNKPAGGNLRQSVSVSLSMKPIPFPLLSELFHYFFAPSLDLLQLEKNYPSDILYQRQFILLTVFQKGLQAQSVDSWIFLKTYVACFLA